MNKNYRNQILCFIFCLFNSLSVIAQGEIAFTNKVVFSKTGNMEGVRLIVLMPAPVTNEYQEIRSLSSNYGTFIELSKANKVLLYDSSFEDQSLEVVESFVFRAKPFRLDLDHKGNKNIVAGVDPNQYLGSDGILIDVGNSAIRSLGDQLWQASSNIIDYAKRCYEYVAAHYRYINGGWRTLSEIIQVGGGECGDFTTLFVNLMRYKGIPARHNIGVLKDGGFHVWPDFYHEDFGWIPVDPTFKNSNPDEDYFGRYDGDLIILSQGLTSFSASDVEVQDIPLQTFLYWYWYQSGVGSINGVHMASMNSQVDALSPVKVIQQGTNIIYRLNGIRQTIPHVGINIINGKKVFMK
ncbi:MAG: transglutaminase domain-containing protein [Bacteroidaceae bacterium]|nr:transglutaminase domain-containing protein [Bacteroidaceae bacterium]